MRAFLVAISLMALTAAASVEAGPQSALSQGGNTRVESAWARLAPNQDDTASVFFEVSNGAGKPDVLLSASSPNAKTVSLRRGKFLGYSFFNKESDGIKISACERTSFHPGAFEITLSDFTMPVEVRTTLPVTLVFRDAGVVQIEATVSYQLLGNRINK